MCNRFTHLTTCGNRTLQLIVSFPTYRHLCFLDVIVFYNELFDILTLCRHSHYPVRLLHLSYYCIIIQVIDYDIALYQVMR